MYYPCRWVSGVDSVHHPLVWTACTAYTNSTTLRDRVWGEGHAFLCLVYCEGCVQPCLWQCQAREEEAGEMGVAFEISTGEAVIQV